MLLKICCSIWNNVSRDKRELSAYQELGAEIIVMAKGDTKDKYKKDVVDGFKVLRFSSRPLGNHIFNSVNRLVSIFTWAYYARKLCPNIISGHDLGGLFIGWVSSWFLPRARKPKLIYDSHEFEIGRNAKRNKLQILAITYLERFLMKRCSFSIMVNDSIADEVQKIHHLSKRPIVVRNVAPHWDKDESACLQIRQKFCQALGVSEDTFLIMYHGGLVKGRGIENILQVLALKPDIRGILLGNGEDKYINELKQLATDLGVSNQVLFHQAVPIEILKNYVGAVNVGMITIPAVAKSYYYMLPNKFFENIQTETPIIGSNFPEIQRLTNKYQIGLLCDPTDLKEIAACINKMQTDRSFYQQCKENLKIAKEDLCWEKEKQVLKQALLNMD